jgi:hypothetical protein
VDPSYCSIGVTSAQAESVAKRWGSGEEEVDILALRSYGEGGEGKRAKEGAPLSELAELKTISRLRVVPSSSSRRFDLG